MAIPNIKSFGSNAARTAGAGVLALSMAFTPLASTAPANAQDAQNQRVAYNQISVPARDVRQNSPDNVRLTAAMASNDKQLIVFYGNDQAAYEQTRVGAHNAIKSGYPLAGMFIASGRSSIEFYADGQLTETILNPNASGLDKTIYETIQHDYSRVIRPRQLSMVDSPNTPRH